MKRKEDDAIFEFQSFLLVGCIGRDCEKTAKRLAGSTGALTTKLTTDSLEVHWSGQPYESNGETCFSPQSCASHHWMKIVYVPVGYYRSTGSLSLETTRSSTQ